MEDAEMCIRLHVRRCNSRLYARRYASMSTTTRSDTLEQINE